MYDLESLHAALPLLYFLVDPPFPKTPTVM